MKEFFPVLHMAALFSGISDEELAAMLSCLGARIDTFPKGSRLLRAGEQVEEVGLVLAGSTLIVQEDIWGNRNILSKTGPGQTFAEVFACAPGAVLNVSVEAESAVTVMFLHIRRVLSVCPSACSHHSRIIRNLLGELAEKNLRLNEKLTHMAQRTTRAKLMSYFSAEAQRLIDVTQQSFFEGIRFAREGQRLSDISAAVQKYVEDNGYSVVREYVGHGIGRKMHESPEVPNFGAPGHGPRLLRGMTIAVEPMVNAGGAAVRVMPDGWTVKTQDGSLAAHYENTILITDGEAELLTLPEI